MKGANMFGFICSIFVAVFIIVNRMFLSPFEMGTLILLTMLIATIEVYMNYIMRSMKHDKDRQSSTEGD